MFEKDLKIEFVKEFVSTRYGNVYLGKTLTLDSKAAQKEIDHGYAKLFVEKGAEKPKEDEIVELLAGTAAYMESLPDSFKLTDEQELSIEDVLKSTFEADGKTAKQWNALRDTTRDGKIKDYIDSMSLIVENMTIPKTLDESVDAIVSHFGATDFETAQTDEDVTIFIIKKDDEEVARGTLEILQAQVNEETDNAE